MDSLARTRKLPSLPVLESSSSALERVMLPWFQQGTMAGVGLRGLGRWPPPGSTGHRWGAEAPETLPPAACPLSAARAAATSSLTDDFLFQALCEGKETRAAENFLIAEHKQEPMSSTFLPHPPRPLAPASHSPNLSLSSDESQSPEGQMPAQVLGGLAAPLGSGGL